MACAAGGLGETFGIAIRPSVNREVAHGRATEHDAIGSTSSRPARTLAMDLLLLTVLTVGIAEIGDRSMLVAVLLGIRYQHLWPVFWGMVAGLLANQVLSALLGVWLFSVIPPSWHGTMIGVAFLVMAVWMLIPETAADSKQPSARRVFVACAIMFFVLEMADKTQLAVVTLAGASGSPLVVVPGAMIGILLVTTPALVLGHRFAKVLPMHDLRILGSVLFLALGAWIVLDAAGWLPHAGAIDPSRFIGGLGGHRTSE
jgi:Ca2+/H+ antiporter, TMEM165/GDT1 family